MSGRKIALVTSWTFPYPGGVSTHLQLLAAKLGIPEEEVVGFRQICAARSRGVARAIFALRRRARATLAVETVSLPARTLQDLLGGMEFDIAHCHDAMATWAALRARRRRRRSFRIVTTIHGPVSRHMVEEGFGAGSADVRKVEECEREAWRGADAVIAVDTLQGRIAESQGAPPGKITVIPNAVDMARIERLASALPILPADERPWVLVPRRLAPKNGVAFAIRALGALDRSPRPRLLLAGSGPERPRLEKVARELGRGGDVVFLGDLDHRALLPLMKGAAVVLVPSVPVHGIEEATSIAALEAMALARPVVASAIGGLQEIIRDGESGLLVPPGDPEALAQAIARLLDDAALRARLGEGARARVSRDFSDAVWFERHQALYARL